MLCSTRHSRFTLTRDTSVGGLSRSPSRGATEQASKRNHSCPFEYSTLQTVNRRIQSGTLRHCLHAKSSLVERWYAKPKEWVQFPLCNKTARLLVPGWIRRLTDDLKLSARASTQEECSHAKVQAPILEIGECRFKSCLAHRRKATIMGQ